jgi:hypothetical protein
MRAAYAALVFGLIGGLGLATAVLSCAGEAVAVPTADCTPRHGPRYAVAGWSTDTQARSSARWITVDRSSARA